MPKDPVLAGVWLSLSAAQGDKTARLRRDALDSRLTSSQRAEIRKRVDAMQAGEAKAD